jgi:type IV secretion system protein VirB3
MSEQASEAVSGFEIPLHVSLTQPIFLGGVPRSYAILVWTVAGAVGLGLQLWYIGFPLGLVLHSVGYWLAKKDAHFLDIMRRNMWHPVFLR